ncbi:MAG TPA: hypothetical protein VGG35_02565 [Streptosporangiaceae bacterium]|jgi:hypothetical protein
MGTGTDLTGVDFFFLIAPVVLALFIWVAAVLWADNHPNVRHVGLRPQGYQHSSYARTDDDALAGESSPAMSAADEDPARAAAASTATAGTSTPGTGPSPAGQPAQPAAPGPETR